MSPRWHGQPQRVLSAFTAAGTATKFGGVTNLPSIWAFVPNVTFSVGVTATFPVSGTYQSNNYVTDPENDTITLTKNSVFVQGVTWDGGKFITNGTGSATTSTGHILTANDGRGHFVESSTFQIALVTTVSVTVSASGNRVLMTDNPAEGPDTTYASRLLSVPWENANTGDWRDLNDAAQGTANFATVAVPSVVGAPTAFDFTGAGMLSLIARLRADNTGIYVKKRAGGSGVSWALKEHATAAYRPVLTLVTSIGNLTPTNLADSSVLPGQGAQGAATTSGGGAPVLKFDLSALVLGVTVSSATLTLTAVNVSGNIGISNWDVYYLDMPRFVTNPAVEVGGVEYGIAASLSSDAALESHGSIVVYDKFESDADINNGDWWWQDRSWPGYRAAPTWATDYSYGTWDDGIGYARITAPMTGGSASFVKLLRVVYPDNWHNSIRPGLPNTTVPKPWSRTWANIEVGTYEELYLRYVIEFDDDVEGGLNHAAMMRMPRFSSFIEDLGNGMTPEAIGMQFSYAPYLRANEGGERSSPPLYPGVFSAGLYEYDHENPTTGTGFPQRAGLNFCWKTGQRYCIEQYMKFNTWNGQGTAYDNDPSHWNADGIIRFWVDGVRVIDVTNRKIRVNAKNKIFFLPWAEFFETTGSNPPGAHTDHHINFGSMAVATQYIGPPQTAPAWARNAALNTWISVPGETRLSTINFGVDAEKAAVPGTGWPPGAEVLDSWSGPCFKRDTSTMILGLGGGHGTGFANVTMELLIGQETPSVGIAEIGSRGNHWIHSSGVYQDLKPTCMHTYNHSVYCGPRDWFMMFGSAPVPGFVGTYALDGNAHLNVLHDPPGWSGVRGPPPQPLGDLGVWSWLTNSTPGPGETRSTYYDTSRLPVPTDGRDPMVRLVSVMDYSTKTWLAPRTVGDLPFDNGAGVFGAAGPSATVVDYRNGDVYASGQSSDLYKWTCETNVWSHLPCLDTLNGYQAWAVDEARNVIWNSGGSGYTPKVFDMDAWTVTTITYTGDGAEMLSRITADGYPYAQYDRGLGCIWLAVRGGSRQDSDPIYTYKITYISATVYNVERITFSGTVPLNPVNGVSTKFQYAPRLGGLLLLNRWDQAVKFVRTGNPQP